MLLRAGYADPEVRAFIEAGQLQQGEAELRARMTRQERADRGSSAEWSAEAIKLAQILVLYRRAKEAEPLLRRAAANFERLGDIAAQVKALSGLADALNQSLESRAAELIGRRAILTANGLDNREALLASAWAQLGASIANQGWAGEALAATNTAMENARQGSGDNAQLVAAITFDLKSRQAGLSYNVKAETEMRAKLDETIKANGRLSTETAKRLSYLATLVGAQGRYDEAVLLSREALSIREALEDTPDSTPIDTRIERRALAGLERRKLLAEADKAGLTFGAAPVQKGAVAQVRLAKRGLDYTPPEIVMLIEGARYDEAEAVLRDRLASRKADEDADSGDVASDVEMLSQSLASAGRFSEAVRRSRELVSLRERIGVPASTARAYWRLAYALNGADDHQAAEIAARRAVALATPLSDKEAPLAAALAELGASLAGQRRRPEAALAFQKAIDVAREKVGEDDVRVADYRNSLALNLQLMGDVVEAERVFRRNLAATIAATARGDIETARTLALLANNLDRQFRREEAELALIEAASIRERALGVRHPQTIASLSNLVSLLAAAQRNAEALELQERVTQLRATLPEISVANQVMDLGLMGEILENRKQIDESVSYRRRALALARAKLDRGHPNRSIATRALAVVLMAKDRSDPEYIKLMRGAVADMREERRRVMLANGATGGRAAETSLANALSDTGRLRSGAIDIYRNALGLNGTYVSNVRSAERRLRAESFIIAQELATTEAGRAFSAIAVRQSLGDTATAAIVRRQQDLATELRSKNRQLIDATDGDPVAAQRISGEIEALSARLAVVDRELRKELPAYARLIAPSPLPYHEVRRRLKPGEGLLLIVKSSYYTFSFAVTRDAFDWSASRTVLNEDRVSIARVRCDADPLTCPSDMAPSPIFDRVTAHELYRQLIQPLEATLQGVKTLYVTTSGELTDLPFAALITAKPEGSDTDEALLNAPWLSDRYALVSLPSVAALRAVKAPLRGSGRDPFVGYGAPALGPAGATRGVADPTKLMALPSLPGTEVELKAMARVLGAGADAIRLGARATETAVRADPAVQRARIVAFATHGLLPGELEGLAEPGLIFTPPAHPSTRDDGVLSASEAAALRLSADWVVLSACNTATAAGSGDSLSTLASAFLYAGADALLASRWRVEDEVTAALTVETLANAEANPAGGRAAALQAAMRAVRAGKRADGSAVEGWAVHWAHPASWAPFTLISDGN